MHSNLQQQRPESETPADLIFGRSPAMRKIRERTVELVHADVPLLIEGELGTGKEVLARYLHKCSSRADRPFVKLNCAAIPAPLLESELFGCEAGAFTGAFSARMGLVELADGGTLLLDNIAELDPSLEPKLLQLLQDGSFYALGGRLEKHVGFQLICTSSRPLKNEVDQGRFRADLYYRINVAHICIPPLRERTVDIPDLSSYLLEKNSQWLGLPAREISGRLLDRMVQAQWPGNIRQLENYIKRYLIFGTDDALFSELDRMEPWKPVRSASNGAVSLKMFVRNAAREIERAVILESLQAHNWNRREAARSLRISYRSMFYKMKELDLPHKKSD